MVILHLTTFLQGGAGLAIATLAAAQHAAGHEVVVVTSLTGPLGYGNYSSQLEYLARTGVSVYAVDSLFSRQPADWSPVLTRLLTLPAAVHADICHAHAATPARIAREFNARTRPKPVVMTMHGWGIRKDEAQARADVEAMNGASAVVVPARTSAGLMTSLGVEAARIRLIEYGVAPREPQPPTEIHDEMRRWQEAGGVVLCCPGTIGARKNQRGLLEALALPGPQQQPPVLAVFVGDGETADLIDEAVRRGLSDRVRVCGYRPDARDVTAAADFMILPSLSEGQPLSILEAFADGVPVILSDIPELRELLGDTTPPLTFEPRDPADIARVIAHALALPPETRRRLARDGQERWASRFSLPRMCEAYGQLYADVLAS